MAYTVKNKLINIIKILINRMQIAIRIPLTFTIYIDVINTFRLPTLKGIKFPRRYPIISMRYLSLYLSRSFDIYCRADCLINHYRFLNSHIQKESIIEMINRSIIIWEESTQYNTLSISMNIPYSNREGDLSLMFYVDSTVIYNLLFTIVHKQSVLCSKDWKEDNVIFITRVQGIYGKYNLIQMVTKHFEYVTPAALLFTAVQGIAAALGIKHIVGITFQEQVASCDPDCSDRLFNCYDGFWTKMGGQKVNDRVFLLPAIPQGKSLSQVKARYRERKRRKRELQNLVYCRSLDSFRQFCPRL